MENILVWALLIAAIAIILMLVLLIASERELKRKRAEVESLRAGFKDDVAGAEVEIPSDPITDQHKRVYTEIAALNEQLQSNIRTLQDELARLRSENAELSRAKTGFQGESAELSAPCAQSIPSPNSEEPALRAADNRHNETPPRRRAPLTSSAVALLLIAGASIYFIPVWRETTFGPLGEANILSVDQSIETFASNTGDKPGPPASADDASRAKTEESAPQKNAPQKKSAPAGASYRVVRSTRVFSEPNYSSRPLARVEAGMEIDVVGVRDEWLEVRSRHGRPPGFIRKEAAIMKDLR